LQKRFPIGEWRTFNSRLTGRLELVLFRAVQGAGKSANLNGTASTWEDPVRRITIVSDLFVLLGLMAITLGHFRYTRRIVPKPVKRAVEQKRRLLLPAAATAAAVAGTALFANAGKAAK
jgi:hypothetical protein